MKQQQQQGYSDATTTFELTKYQPYRAERHRKRRNNSRSSSGSIMKPQTIIFCFLVLLTMSSLDARVDALCNELLEETYYGLVWEFQLARSGVALICPFVISGENCPSSGSLGKTTKNNNKRDKNSNRPSSSEEAIFELGRGNEITVVCLDVYSDRKCIIDCPSVHFRVASGSFLELDGFEFRGSDSASIEVEDEGKLVLSNSVFEGNGDSSIDGGAIRAGKNSELEIVNTLFEDNKGAKGGAIYSDGSVAIRKSIFKDNEAKDSGGAIFSRMGVLDVKETTFDGNEAGYNGPAILTENDDDVVLRDIWGCDNDIKQHHNGSDEKCDQFNTVVDHRSDDKYVCRPFDGLC